MQSKSKLIRKLILEVLKDGEEHSIGDLKKYIVDQDAELLEVANTLNSVLHYMIKSDSNIIRVTKGVYRYSDIEQPANGNGKMIGGRKVEVGESYCQIIGEIQSICERIEKSLKPLTYELSEEEYQNNKKKYELKRKLESIVKKI